MLSFWLVLRVAGFVYLGLFGLNNRYIFCFWWLRIWMIFFAEMVFENLIIQTEAIAPLLTIFIRDLSFIVWNADKFFGREVDIFQKAFKVIDLVYLILHVIELQVNLSDFLLSYRWLRLGFYTWSWSQGLRFVWFFLIHRRWRYEWFAHLLIINKSLNSLVYDFLYNLQTYLYWSSLFWSLFGWIRSFDIKKII